MIKAVFFDLYHTLMGYEPPREEAVAGTLGRIGVKVSAKSLRRPLVSADEFFYRETSKIPLKERNEEETMALWVSYQTVVLKEAGIAPTPELIKNILADMKKAKYELVLFDDVLPALAALAARKLSLGLISNADRDISPLLEKLGVLSLLKVRLTSQEAGVSKPHADIFRLGAERMGVAPGEALYVGDQWVVDVQGARGAGMQALLLDRGGYFEEIPASEKISSLKEIINRI
ncbi:MAG: HAD family hydrolase [Dehalococcoidia bacterium]|nr:MAG: HAD family hydrolase [Dehalococcoidia bacterium]